MRRRDEDGQALPALGHCGPHRHRPDRTKRALATVEEFRAGRADDQRNTFAMLPDGTRGMRRHVSASCQARRGDTVEVAVTARLGRVAHVTARLMASALMNQSTYHRIGPVRGDLPAPCAAAALSSLTGRTVAACHRVLAHNHGRWPLDSAVTPAVLTSLGDLGFGYVLERHEPPPTFVAWAARAAPGAYLVVVPAHILAAQMSAVPGGGVTLQVADNGEFATPRPAPPGDALLGLPVHESIRCEPRAGRRAPAPTL